MKETTPPTQEPHKATGHLAMEFCGKSLPVIVCESRHGFFIGTVDEGLPCSRESNEYFGTRNQAATALITGSWTQKQEP